MTVSEKVSRRNRHHGRSPLEGLRWTITITQKIAVIRNAISTLSLLFVAAENGAVDVCRYLLARSRFSSFSSQELHNDLDLIFIPRHPLKNQCVPPRPGVEVDEPANNGFSPLFTAAQ